MSPNLPDEIVAEILSPALKVPEHLFSDTSLKSPFASYSCSSSSALLVCRSWLRVATPLLYAVVILRSKAQVRAFHAALQSTPSLGPLVKKPRVEGGFGNVMHQILQTTPNVSDILLSLQIHSSDSSAGLALGLPLINPTRLIILDDPSNPLKNKAVVQLMVALKIRVPKWTHLEMLHLPYDRLSPSRESLCTSLCTPTVKTLSFPTYRPSLLPYLVEISRLPSLKVIEIRPKTTHNAASPPETTDSRLNELLRRDNSPENLYAGTYNANVFSAIDPSFRPMASIPQTTIDSIWSRILFFAMLSLEQHPKNTPPMRLEDKKINSARLQLLLVSVLFDRLALPYLYRYPVFRTAIDLARFSSALASQPTIGAHIRELDVRIVGPDSSAIPTILSRTCNLTHLIGYGRHSFSWDAFTTLAVTAGSTLQEFTGFSFKFDLRSRLTTHSPGVFTHFIVLRSVAWHFFPRSSIGPPQFGAVGEASGAALPALKSLSILTPEVLSMFSEMALPSLQHVVFDLRKDWDTTFLRKHGNKIQHVQVRKATIEDQSVLTLCPNLTTLSCFVYATDDYDIGCDTLSDGFKHTYLTKLIVDKDRVTGKVRNEIDWKGFFLNLDLSHLPAVREVSIDQCEWPTTEHEISKSLWVKWAENLLEIGVKLTDEKGTEWRPRLKNSRR
ncbi:hypothetical protein DFH06DRAFT_1243803 [Mycena polygramma]|nr:hypothetical protein DFH06DRAFT_1243803 [Mycena polygramma]